MDGGGRASYTLPYDELVDRAGSSVRARSAFAVAASVVLSLAGAEAAYRAWRDRGCAPPPDGVFELYVVGESTAAGDPYDPWISPAKLVSSLFDGRIGGREIRPIVVAWRGQSIYPQAFALERALRCRDGRNPGAVLVYSGHNDAGGARAASAFERLDERVFSRSALLGDLIFYAERKGFIARERTFEAWRYNLRRVVAMSRRAGLVPVLATAASNQADVDPGLPGGDAPPAKAILARGRALESSGRYGEALDYYASQALLHPFMSAYLKYRSGKCHEALGRYALARRDYQEAVDDDDGDSGTFGRATSAQNDYIRDLAASESVPLADAAAIFALHSPHGLVGDALFSDGHHPSVAGYILLSGVYAARLAEAFHEPLRRSFAGPGDVRRRFPLSPREEAAIDVRSGRWYFNVAVRHGNPIPRLTKSRDYFRRAAILAPDSFSAWVGLGLAQAGLRSNLVSSAEGIRWLERRRLCHWGSEPIELDKDELADVAARLRRDGASADALGNISRSYGAESMLTTNSKPDK